MSATTHHTLLIHNALLPTPEHRKGIDACIAIDGERISAVFTGESAKYAVKTHTADNIFDAGGSLVMPGVIDCHVHFRDPGLTHKGDMASESRAALAGGVTSVIDMPNTKPPTVSRKDLLNKHKRAEDVSLVNYGFFIGATDSNLEELQSIDYTNEAMGVKVFMGSSTGNMLVDNNDALISIFSTIKEPIVVHAEDQRIIDENARQVSLQGAIDDIATHAKIRSAQACIASSRRAVELAEKYGSRLHIAHITTADELDLVARAREKGNNQITCEVSPLHLTFTDADYDNRGTRIKVNPAIKTSSDRDALRRAVRTGLIDIIATDHAPHLSAEKQGNVLTAASGAPSIQFSLPLMLTLLDDPWLVSERMSVAPARCFDIADRGSIAPGMYADITIVKQGVSHIIDESDVLSPCGWTPYKGISVNHCVRQTFVNGKLAYSINAENPFAPSNAKRLTRKKASL